MIVEAIADFTPEVLKSLGVNPHRERSRSRDQESSPRVDSTQKNSTSDSSRLYKFFKAKQLIKVLADGGNGWWYGHCLSEADSASRAPPSSGYFPSNYVTVVHQTTPSQAENIGEELEQPEEDIQVYDSGDVDYAEFAKKLVSKEQVNWFSYRF